MAKSVIKRIYKTPDAVAAGLVTFSDLEDETNTISHDLIPLIGGKKVHDSLTPVGKWLLNMAGNNVLGDTFAGDPVGFKEASTRRYEKLLAGDVGRAGTGGGKQIGLVILALMRIWKKDEAEVREIWNGMDDTLQEEYTEHKQVKLVIKEIKDERSIAKTKALRAEAKDAPALAIPA